ncbi:hypothetical protein TrVE_jg11150 [Triparma verrucosa]|uniref:Uncharacterized protein n=1 Tax=Triparma verrucosa TaxID=1606542 RepID=A0A9W7FAM8_9STRA|nr:hypothetical protein TrVE_jg11150 [Triparma verrucosa]
MNLSTTLSRSSNSSNVRTSPTPPSRSKKGKASKMTGKDEDQLTVNPIFERVGDYTRDAERRQLDRKLFAAAIFGLALAIMSLELTWLNSTWIDGMDEESFLDLVLPNPASKTNPNKMIAMTPPPAAIACQVICTLSTFVLLYLRYELYMFEHALKESLWNNVVKLDFIYDQQEFTIFVLEMTVLCIHPLPLAGSQNIAVCLMFLRFYLFLHLFRDHSTIYKSRRDIIVKIFDKIPNPHFNWFQTAQFEIDQNPIRFMAVLTTYYFFVFSYCIYVIEREYNPVDYTWLYGCWHTITVMTTLGFNNVPATFFGKLCTFIAAITGIFLETLFTVTVIGHLSLSHYQDTTQNFLEKRVADEEERHSAASYIQERFRFVLYRHRQERMRSNNKTISMVDEPEVYAKKETKHKQRQAQRLLEFHKCRRFKFLKSNSAGDPFVDKLNAIGRLCEKVYLNTRKQEAKEMKNGSLPSTPKFSFLKKNSAGDPFVDKLDAINRLCEKVFQNTKKQDAKEEGESKDGRETATPILQRALREEEETDAEEDEEEEEEEEKEVKEKEEEKKKKGMKSDTDDCNDNKSATSPALEAMVLMLQSEKDMNKELQAKINELTEELNRLKSTTESETEVEVEEEKR